MNRLTANAADLAADYKARGVDRQAAYSSFVIDRALKPEIDAKEFQAIFDAVSPCKISDFVPAAGNFEPTHWDTENDEPVEIYLNASGLWYDMKWRHGHTGSNPLNCMDKYIPISEKKVQHPMEEK